MASRPSSRVTTAFIRLAPGSEEVLAAHGCQSLTHFGDLHIATIPIDQLLPLTGDHRVLRIEASPTGHLATDSMAAHLNATDAYTGLGLPQAYTGHGVVMGVMDVGFDLTHPTFYSRDTTQYRISRFWDQVTQDTVGSPLPVGRDYTSRSDILSVAHSRDGLDLTHGTHTLGIAAGSGYDSPYRGMAPEADICLVANAVTDDLQYIDSADVEKYTYAMDALGFKYIFDYADAVGKPCVISFSEGSPQDFHGYDQLYYAFLDSLVGPGHILVAAAGNEGHNISWIHKRPDQPSAGIFLASNATEMTVALKSANDFKVRMVTYDSKTDTLLFSPFDALQAPDSTLLLQLSRYELQVEAYPNCYDDREMCFDITAKAQEPIGLITRLSIELLGQEADVELWRQSGTLYSSSRNPLLCDGETTHNVHSPSSAPCVISVGSNSYREFIVNYQGDTLSYWSGTGGVLVEPSSKGPTMDGRIKPDCVAPGNNIISAYSSYYMEEHPNGSDLRWDVAHFPFQGRSYAWNSNSGTSMAAPAVGGAIALWLQACPSLTPADVLGILSRTCRHYDPQLTYPNNMYGYGEIDVYAGLLDILGISGIEAIPQKQSSARFCVGNGQLHIELQQPSSASQPLRLFDLSGHPVFSANLPQGSLLHHIPLPHLPSGVYAVCIGNSSSLIRL